MQEVKEDDQSARGQHVPASGGQDLPRPASERDADNPHCLPWRRLEYRDSQRLSLSIVNANGERVASIANWIRDSDDLSDLWAEFVVRACNSRNDLLAALKRARREYGACGGRLSGETLVQMDAAIAKAEG